MRFIKPMLLFSLSFPLAIAALSGCGGGPDSGFRPDPNGFGFENYTNEDVTNLTVEDMRRMFGDQVCATMMGGCQLTPAAEQWAIKANEGMGGGHCFGFSNLALQFYRGKLKPSDFGSDRTVKLTKEGNTPLQREIAYWMATQNVPAYQEKFINKLAPNEFLEKLSAAFKDPNGERYTIGMYRRDRSGGHAITPFAIQEAGDIARVLVYDNNVPKEERVMEIDRKANTWKYLASTNPNEMASVYEGDAETKTLLLAPVSAAEGKLPCPFCGDMGSPGEVVQVEPSGDGDVTVTDELGRVASLALNQIPGSSVNRPFTGSLAGDSAAPTFNVPSGMDLNIRIDGTKLSKMSPESLAVLGPGYVLAVSGVALDPMQVDTLKVSKSGDSLNYKTSGMETPTVTIGVQTPGADYLFSIAVAGAMNGQEAALKLYLKDGLLSVKLPNGANNVFGVRVIRLDQLGVSVFTHASNSISGNNTLYYDFATWAGQGTPMTVGLDLDSDGILDQVGTITDEG